MITRKIMLLGEMGVGKTSLVKRLVFGTFSANYKSSIGSDIYQHEIEPAPNGQRFVFNVWDTDGSYGPGIFRSVYIRGADAAIVIADATRPATFGAMADLALSFEQELPGRYLALVANKIDLVEGPQSTLSGDVRSLPFQLPERLAELGLPIAPTSAKTGQNVTALFREAAETILRRGI
ncbi:MAG: Rab family GTPase [Hyphomicrobiaceae bacterium]